jgi:hypothetical protein
MDTAIETKREYDEDGAMLYYLNEKKNIEPKINTVLKQCQSHKGSVQLHWHINREGKASQITLMNDSLNCQSVNDLLKEHLSTLQFQKPQPIDRVELDYIFNFIL